MTFYRLKLSHIYFIIMRFPIVFCADLKIAIMNLQLLHIVLRTMLPYMKQIWSIVIAAHIKLCSQRVPTSFFIKFSKRLRAISTGLFYLATRNSSFHERPLELAKFRTNGLQELAMFVQWAQANLIMSQRHWPPFARPRNLPHFLNFLSYARDQHFAFNLI